MQVGLQIAKLSRSCVRVLEALILYFPLEIVNHLCVLAECHNSIILKFDLDWYDASLELAVSKGMPPSFQSG
jgi:hypothetical protein